MTRDRWIRCTRAVGWALLAVVLCSGVTSAIVKGLHYRPDWSDFYPETRYVWTHRAIASDTKMFGYLPSLFFLLWPFTVVLPVPVGLIAFVAVNVAAAVVSLWILYRWWWGRSAGAPFVWAGLLVVGNLQHVLQANQLTLWTLALCLGGLTLVGRRKDLAGGVLIGAAGLVKAMPFLLAGYLLARKKWRALAGMAAAVVVLDIIPSVLVFGVGGAVREHRAWLDRAEAMSNRRQIADPLLVGGWRHGSNFSLSGVLARWLKGVPAADRQVVVFGRPPEPELARIRSTLGADEWLTVNPVAPRDKPWEVVRYDVPHVPHFQLLALSEATVYGIWLAIVGLGLGGLMAWTWWTGRRSSGEDWPEAGALWMLAMLWVTPMMRHYYLPLAIPAVVLAARQVWVLGRARVLSLAALGLWLVGLAGLGWFVGRWYGLHLLALAVVGAAVAVGWVRSNSSDGRNETVRNLPC